MTAERQAERDRLAGKLIEEIRAYAELLEEEWKSNGAVALQSLSAIETRVGGLTRLIFSRRS